MVRTTQTLNPLHFEDLEPHRFEDLVRQLIYDFREWHSLEALGRTGADDGIDIRAFQRVASVRQRADEIDGEGEEEPERFEIREWRVQCKRQKRLGPKKMKEVLAELLETGVDPPYGVVLAAACDFSKRARDTFRSECASRGVEEFFLWGKGELEDLLFRPSNDHLLWAYFGISLRVRRRSVRTATNTRLTMKRRLIKHVGDLGRPLNGKVALIRDADAEEYPIPTDPERFLKAPRWRYYKVLGLLHPDLVLFVTQEHFAWWDCEEGTWDFFDVVDTSWPTHSRLVGVPPIPEHPDTEKVRRFWEVRVPKEFKARHLEVSMLHYDQILAVDEMGDAFHEPPHFVVDFEGRPTPFRRSREVVTRGYGIDRDHEVVDELRRVKYFPKKIPKITEDEWQKHWNPT